MTLRRTPLLLLLLCSAVLLLDRQPAGAHAGLLSAEPPPGARLLQSPSEIRLTFSEALLPGSHFVLYQDQFAAVDSVRGTLDPGRSQDLVAQQPQLPAGRYTVQWTALSQDGHPASGSFEFEIGGGSGRAGWILAGIYLLLGALVLLRGTAVRKVAGQLTLYLLVAAAWTAAQALPLRLGLNQQQLLRYGLLLLTVLFLYLSRSFLRRQGPDWLWWLPGIAGSLAFFLLDLNPLDWPDTLFTALARVFPRQDVADGLAVIAWTSLLGAVTIMTRQSFRQTGRRPMHRNRLTYWALVIVLQVTGGTLIIGDHAVIGSLFHLPAAVLMVYVTQVYQLMDLRRISRQFAIQISVIFISGLIYLGLLFTAERLWPRFIPGRELDRQTLLLVGAAIALLLVLVNRPLFNLIERLIRRLTFSPVYNPNRMVREYSLAISNIVDLERLEAVAIQLISEGLQIRHGTLYLVDFVPAREAYSWKSLQGYATYPLELGLTPVASPVVNQLVSERRPLLQFEVDMLPKFQDLADDERDWLSGLGYEVYVPIHSQGEWIGLLALGAKVSGEAYGEEDFNLLSTLADQTAVALQNARLVADLTRLNAELKQAYADIEAASQQLQEMDRLKSAFIGVITHELRTPFSNIAFSVQILGRYVQQQMVNEQQEQLQQLQREIDEARKMVDGLVSFAAFLRKQGDLQPQWIDFRQVVEHALVGFQPALRKKEMALQLKLPDEALEIYGDSDRLVDAVHHLVDNALKFTPAGGRIRVQSQIQDGLLHFTVEDSGVGIPPERLDELWEGFTQIADPLRRGKEGLGLGLALVRFIVHAHGGEVQAKSEVDTGSTFGFQLPVEGSG